MKKENFFGEKRKIKNEILKMSAQNVPPAQKPACFTVIGKCPIRGIHLIYI